MLHAPVRTGVTSIMQNASSNHKDALFNNDLDDDDNVNPNDKDSKVEITLCKLCLNCNFGLESTTDLILMSNPSFWGMGNHLGPVSFTSV